MNNSKIKDARKQFGEQLEKYRNATGLTQREFSTIYKKVHSNLSRIENGTNSIGILKMQEISSIFGVTYYYLANPDFTIPTLLEMPVAIRRAVAKAEKDRLLNKQAKMEKKATTGRVNKTGLADALHTLKSEGYFKKARTSFEVFLHLYPDKAESILTPDDKKLIASITGTLSKGKFKTLLEKLPPPEGQGRAVRFVVMKKSGKVLKGKK